MKSRKRRSDLELVVFVLAALTFAYCSWQLVTEDEPSTTWIQNPP